MVSKVTLSTIIYGMNNIFDGVAFITVPRNVFPADDACGRWSQICSASPTWTPIIHTSIINNILYKGYYH